MQNPASVPPPCDVLDTEPIIVNEEFDILTETGEPTGIRKSRKLVHRDGDFHASVHMWLFNKKGELLLQKRALCKDCFPGRWDISSAGHIAAGQLPIPTCYREFEEELGIDLHTVGDPVYLTTVKGHSQQPERNFVNNEFMHIFFVCGDVPIESFSIQECELTEVRYFPFEDAMGAWARGDPTFTPLYPETYGRIVPQLREISLRLRKDWDAAHPRQ